MQNFPQENPSGRSAASTINTRALNQTVALSEGFSSADIRSQTLRYNIRDALVEGLGIILEEDQLFHQYTTDAQGNTRRHLAAIFYPEDKKQGWPAITTADYLIRRARSLGRDDLIQRLKDKGIQESGGDQGEGGALVSKLTGDRYEQLHHIIIDCTTLYYDSNYSHNRTVIFRDTANGLLQEYKSRIFSWHSKTSTAFVKKWTQLISSQKASGKLDQLVFAISDLMQEKNNIARESRLRDSLLKLWQAGIYLMAGEEIFVDQLIKKESQFLSIPLYPVEMQTSHPQSRDTVGSYLLRILVERKNTRKIEALLKKNIEPPIDVILPKGLQSVGEKNRAERVLRQAAQRRQEEQIRILQKQKEEQRREAKKVERDRQQRAAEEKAQREKQEAERKQIKERRYEGQRKKDEEVRRARQQHSREEKAQLEMQEFKKEIKELRAEPASRMESNVTASGGNGGDSSSSESDNESQSSSDSVSSLTDNHATIYRRRKVKGHSLHDMSDALRHQEAAYEASLKK